jgi:hypothetical protein
MPMRITVTAAEPHPETCDVVGPALTTAQAGQVMARDVQLFDVMISGGGCVFQNSGDSSG